MPTARLARASDLSSLLDLFEVSEVSAAAQPRERAQSIWQETLAQPGTYVLVSDDGDRIAATCMLITAPNLLREGRRHAFLENVVSHPELRGRGHGKAVVQAALAHAWTAGCHHVLMQSGRADPGVHRFYEALGFQPGLRIAYAAGRLVWVEGPTALGWERWQECEQKFSYGVVERFVHSLIEAGYLEDRAVDTQVKFAFWMLGGAGLALAEADPPDHARLREEWRYLILRSFTAMRAR